MSDEANRLLQVVSELIVINEVNSKLIQQKIDSKQNMKCKRLSFSRALYDGVLKSTSHILNALLQAESDLYSIKRYYLKPLLEDFVNLYNIEKFGLDYVRAMQVHFMSEDYDIDSRYRDDYAQLGVSFNKSKEESKKHVLKKMNDHFDELPSNLKDKFHKGKADYQKNLSVSNRITLADVPKYNNLSIKAFYDYANVHHHFDLRFDWLAEEDDTKFKETLLIKLEEYITKSAQIFHGLFKIKPQKESSEDKG
ncbi:hypothetical protein J27TS7_16030 [Paenibacillus dendritiformis]|uniref:hypothetical protein n=1 Tax=Paenibacillus dendritiformis TaxID=130049 RepID=UPI001B2BB0F3|nr:hypothetical protein [Paenibacillus dendritiformis]GIO72089.1 hypothetical protein J27TS7_16030 [Paenibacillus dendritiformis]